MANDQRRTTNDLLLYYITDRTAFAPDEPTRRRRLLEKIAEAARGGIDYIQLREKDLSSAELESLTREAVQIVRAARRLAPGPWPQAPALLVNSRTDVALAADAEGVHLRSDDVSPREVIAVWRRAHVGTAALGCTAGQSPATAAAATRESSNQQPLVGVSCHTPAEVRQAADSGATFAVFAPVFQKKDAPDTEPKGLAQLHEACKAKIPVLALGGVTLENAKQCLEVGASGIAAIRLFQENDVAKTVEIVRQVPR